MYTSASRNQHNIHGSISGSIQATRSLAWYPDFVEPNKPDERFLDGSGNPLYQEEYHIKSNKLEEVTSHLEILGRGRSHGTAATEAFQSRMRDKHDVVADAESTGEFL